MEHQQAVNEVEEKLCLHCIDNLPCLGRCEVAKYLIQELEWLTDQGHIQSALDDARRELNIDEV